MRKPGKVQMALLQEMADGVEVKRQQHQTYTGYFVTIRWRWMGSREWKESTISAVVRKGWAEWVGAPITAIRITEAGKEVTR